VTNHHGDQTFLRRTVWVLLMVSAAALVVELAPMLLLVFAGVLVAILFDALLQGVEHWLRLPHRWALLLAVLLLVIGFGLAFAFFGAQVQRQVIKLQDALPQA
jgi:predicted PurR-regulated permease PerM